MEVTQMSRLPRRVALGLAAALTAAGLLTAGLVGHIQLGASPGSHATTVRLAGEPEPMPPANGGA